MEIAEATNTVGIPRTKSGKPLYIVFRNNDGLEFKVANLDNPDVCPTEGIVEYEAIKKRDFERMRTTDFSCPAVLDKASGLYYGEFNGFTKSGQPKWKRFPLGMINVFDRTIPAEARKACILSKSPIVVDSPNLSHNIKHHLFRVVDKDKAAHNEIMRIEKGQRAVTIAKGLHGQELFDYARNLGFDPNHMSYTMVQAEVLKKAEKEPAEFLSVHENPNLGIITVFNRALQTGVIEHDLTVGYKFHGYTFGHTFDLAVKFLQDHSDVLTTIDLRSKEKISQSEKIMKGNSSSMSAAKDDKDIELEVMKKELEALKKQNADLAASKIRETVGEDSISNPLEKEFNELIAEAKTLKFKGLHLYKPNRDSMDKLKAKLAEAKK
jgi:hypothetical protein